MARQRKLEIAIVGDATSAKSALGEVEGKLGTLGRSIGKIAKVGAFAGGALIAGGLTKGFFDALDQEAVTDRVAAGLGLNEAESAKLGSAAGDLYANAWGDSYDEAATAIQASIASGLVDITESSADELQNIGALGLDLATVFGEDVTRVAQVASQLVKNKVAPDAAAAYDIIAAGQTNNLNVAGDLLDTLDEYSTAFGRLGLSGDDVLTVLNQGLEAGVFNTDKIGDAFNEFSVRAIDGSEGVKDAVKELGFGYDDFATRIAEGGDVARITLSDTLHRLREMDDQVAQDATGVALFGSMWEDLGAEAILALDPAADGLKAWEDSAESLSETLNDNLGARIESLKRRGFQALADVARRYLIPAVESLFDFIENTAVPVLQSEIIPAVLDWAKGMRDDLQPVVEAVGRWISDRLWPAIQRLIPTIGDMLTKLVGVGRWIVEHKPVLIGIATAIGVGLVAAFTSWAIAAGAAAIATIAAIAPVIAIGAAIAALVAGVIYAYENWGWFRDTVDAVAQFLTDTLWPALQDIWKVITENVIPVIVQVVQTFGRFVAAVAQRVIPIVQRVIAILAAMVRFIVQRVIPTVLRIATTIVNVAVTIGRKVGEIVGFITGIPGRIASTVSTMWNGLRDGITGAKDWVGDRIDDMVMFFRELPGRITNAALGMAAAGRGIVEDLLEGAVGALSSAAGFAADLVSGLWRAFKDLFNLNVVGPINRAIPNSIGLGPFSVNLPDNPIPTLHSGGIVPGRPGQEMLAVLEAGETVIPAGASMSGGSERIEMRIYLDGREITDSVRTQLIRTGNRNGGRIFTT